MIISCFAQIAAGAGITVKEGGRTGSQSVKGEVFGEFNFNLEENTGISPTAGGGGLGRLRSSPPSPGPQVQRSEAESLVIDSSTCHCK